MSENEANLKKNSNEQKHYIDYAFFSAILRFSVLQSAAETRSIRSAINLYIGPTEKKQTNEAVVFWSRAIYTRVYPTKKKDRGIPEKFQLKEFPGGSTERYNANALLSSAHFFHTIHSIY